MKRKLSLALAFVMLAATMTACGSTESDLNEISKDSTQSEQTETQPEATLVAPEAVPTEADTRIVMNIGGKDVSYAELRYFLLSMKDQYGDIGADILLEQAETEIALSAASFVYAEELGLVLPEDVRKQSVEDSVAQVIAAIEQDGTTTYAEELERFHYTDVYYRKLLETMAVQSYVYQQKYAEGGELYDVTDEDILNYANDNYVRVKHILIKTQDLDESEKASKRALVDTILEQAKSGEVSFEDLVTEYSEDGMDVETGYYFTYNMMVPEFETASFALEVDEVSDVVESTYGYHIIKKYAMEDEHILKDEAIREAAVSRISVDNYYAALMAKAAELEITYAADFEAAVEEIFSETESATEEAEVTEEVADATEEVTEETTEETTEEATEEVADATEETTEETAEAAE